MTQQELDALHIRILTAMNQYRQGTVMVDEMLEYMDKMYMSYEADALVGLIDPATGLKYHNAEELAEEEAEYQRMLLDIEQQD